MKFDRTLLRPDELDSRSNPKWFKSWDVLDKYYTDKAELSSQLVINKLAPSFAELGVRNGYCAWAFLKANPRAAYSGYELTSDALSINKALQDRFPRAKVNIYGWDVTGLKTLAGVYDFVHINGTDTSLDAKVHELELAMNCVLPSGHLVVNDYLYKHNGHIKEAVIKFTDMHKKRIKCVTLNRSLRGEALIQLV